MEKLSEAALNEIIGIGAVKPIWRFKECAYSSQKIIHSHEWPFPFLASL